jgi:hypothetical protein
MEEAEGLGSCDDCDAFQREAARVIVASRGGRVSGRGGVGKTELIRRVVERFIEEGWDEKRIDVMATTHVASSNVDSKTILSHLHRCSGCKEHVLIIDEISMVSLGVFAYLAEGLFVGSIFVVIGDEFQIPPIASDVQRWKQLPHSDFMHDMCGGLVVKLRKFRRRQQDPVTGLYAPGEQLHFSNVGPLYPKLGECEDALLPCAIQRARLMYPNTGAEVQTTLCVTNKRRKAINETENRRLAPVGAIACEYKGGRS